MVEPAHQRCDIVITLRIAEVRQQIVIPTNTILLRAISLFTQRIRHYQLEVSLIIFQYIQARIRARCTFTEAHIVIAITQSVQIVEGISKPVQRVSRLCNCFLHILLLAEELISQVRIVTIRFRNPRETIQSHIVSTHNRTVVASLTCIIYTMPYTLEQVIIVINLYVLNAYIIEFTVGQVNLRYTWTIVHSRNKPLIRRCTVSVFKHISIACLFEITPLRRQVTRIQWNNKITSFTISYCIQITIHRGAIRVIYLTSEDVEMYTCISRSISHRHHTASRSIQILYADDQIIQDIVIIQIIIWRICGWISLRILLITVAYMILVTSHINDQTIFRRIVNETPLTLIIISSTCCFNLRIANT